MIVIVVGMHRSGTSAVAGILHLNGIFMGSKKNFKPKPLPQNPKGFYENYDFRRLSDKILSSSGYKVKSFDSKVPKSITAQRYARKMSELIDNNDSRYQSWGWKDPRVCLTLHCWLDVLGNMGLLGETRIVFTARRAVSVAKSLEKRNHLSIEDGLKLWSVYNRTALNILKTRSVPVFHFFYEDLLDDPQSVCNKMFCFLDVMLDSSVLDKFIDPRLNRSIQKVEFHADPKTTEIMQELEFLSRDSISQ